MKIVNPFSWVDQKLQKLADDFVLQIWNETGRKKSEIVTSSIVVIMLVEILPNLFYRTETFLSIFASMVILLLLYSMHKFSPSVDGRATLRNHWFFVFLRIIMWFFAVTSVVTFAVVRSVEEMWELLSSATWIIFIYLADAEVPRGPRKRKEKKVKQMKLSPVRVHG